MPIPYKDPLIGLENVLKSTTIKVAESTGVDILLTKCDDLFHVRTRRQTSK